MSKKIKLTQGKFAIVDDADFYFLNQWKWQCVNNYAVRTAHIEMRNGKHHQRPVHMHRIILGTPHGYDTDHINGNPLDNRKINLRICTREQNQGNSKPYGKTSKYKGVCLHKKSNSWHAQISIKGKRTSLGYFKTEELAHRAYVNAKRSIHPAGML